jgi:hypothetical protein
MARWLNVPALMRMISRYWVIARPPKNDYHPGVAIHFNKLE